MLCHDQRTQYTTKYCQGDDCHHLKTTWGGAHSPKSPVTVKLSQPLPLSLSVLSQCSLAKALIMLRSTLLAQALNPESLVPLRDKPRPSWKPWVRFSCHLPVGISRRHCCLQLSLCSGHDMSSGRNATMRQR